MKKIIAGLLVGVVISGTSCKKYLDINDNPNNATSASPELLLPQALTNTASLINGYNTYGSETGLYAANAGGYGGFGESITYNYTTTGTGNWAATYDNLEDYQTILNQTDGKVEYSYFNGAARIMKVHDFQLLVDAFNDVPYTDALKGGGVLSPGYTDGKEIYKDLAAQLDTAINTINAGLSGTGIKPLGASDVLFKGSSSISVAGEMTLWKQLANTLKLRILVRGNGKVTFANNTFGPDGFLSTDAFINPGYTRDNGKQNPAWSSWAYDYTGAPGNKAWMPSQFAFGFYDGHTLTDPARGRAIYYQFPNTGINRLGIESNSLVSSPSGGGSFWFSGTDRNGKSNGNQVGVLKGPDAGYPILLASESYFLQAEANVRGILPSGSASTLFNNGILAAFNYTYQLPQSIDKSVTIKAGVSPADSAAAYITANTSSYLVNFGLAVSSEQKIEAIITQKFIALNFIHGHEAFNEYRRTHYPKIVPGGTGYQTFASSVSESTRPDKLPTRILYPTTEGTYNSANVPAGITPFTSVVFWAL